MKPSPAVTSVQAFCWNRCILVDCLSRNWMNTSVGSMGELGNTILGLGESQKSVNLLINLYMSTNNDL